MKTIIPRFLLICLIMLISPFRTFAIDESSDYMPQWVKNLKITYDSDRWPDKNKNHTFEGEGSKENPYLIDSDKAFGGLMYYSQQKEEKYMGSPGNPVYYKLTADIDMSGMRCTTIGDKLTLCKAYIKFDGDGYTIKNVVMPYDDKEYSCNGIFGLLFDSEIKNVTFENYFIGSLVDMQGLVGFMNNSRLDNVHVINGMVAGCDCIGGLVGGVGHHSGSFSASEKSTNYIINCSFEGEVHNRNSKQEAYFGGLVGYIEAGNMYIMSSLFRGRLTASNNKYNGRGGLVGQLDSDADVYIDACMIMGNPGSSSGSYKCPLEEDYTKLNDTYNGWAVANVSSSSSKVHLMSRIYICKNWGYSLDNGKVPVACAGSYGSNSKNVLYYDVKGSDYAGLSDGGKSKIETITDCYKDSYKANHGNEGYIYNQYKHYYSVATNGKIVIDKEKPTCVYNVSSDLLLKEVNGPGNQNITISTNATISPTCIYLQNGETFNLKAYKQRLNGSSKDTKGYYPCQVDIDESPISQWRLTDDSSDGQYYNIEITPNSTNLRNDVNVVSEIKPYATNLSVDFNCYDRKAIIYITKATDSSIGAYYDIYRDNDYIGTVYSPYDVPKASYTDTNIPIDNKEREVKYDVYYVDSNNDTDKVLDATIPWKTKIDNLGNSVSCISVMKNELKLSASTEGVSGYNLKLHLSYPDVGLYDGADYKVYVKDTNTPIATGKFSKNDKLLSDNRRQVEVVAGVDDMCNTYEFFFEVTPNGSNAAAQESPHASGKASGKNLISKLMASKGDNKGYAALNINAKKISAGDQLKFTIERKLATEPDDKFTLIGTINSMDAAISYTDDKVTPGNIYRYRVRVYSGCADASTGNIVFNESPDHEIEDYGFCQTKGSVSGRITYNGNNAVENVAVYITSNEAESGTKQYTSAFFQGKRCDVNNDSIQGITFDNIKNLDDMYPYTLQFFMMPENLASRITNYGINVASVPQVVLAIIPPDGESLVGKYRIAPLWKADGDYIDDAAGDGAECYTEGITGNLAMNKFTNVFLQRINESDFRIGVLDVMDGNDVIVWSSPFSTAGNVDKMEQAYRGKLTFARPAGEEYDAYRGWIDDIRLWKGEMSDKALLKYASNILSGTEKNLELYVNFDENLPDYCFDMSSTSNIRNGHHAATYAMQCSYNVPKQEQLGLKGITDENGNYIISGIPFTGEGTLYNVVPVYGTHTFNPTNQQLYISESSLVVNKTDFSDVSSFPVKVRATYYGTTLPVAGANIKIDDVTQVYDGKIMETDEQGYAEVQVPIGRHKMKLEMINHTFAAGGTACDADTSRMLDAEGKGYIDVPNGLDLDQELTFIDVTTVRLIGRAVGGEKEAAKGYNCGLSKNNIGRVQIQLKPTLSGNYSMHNGVFDGASHEVGNDNNSVNSTTVYGRDFITITTDPATGEYDALVPPIEFYTSSISTVNGDNQGDYMKLTTDDFGGAVTISPNLEMLRSDSTYIEDRDTYDKYTYNTLTDFIHYSNPLISLTSDNETHPNMFGERECEYNDAQDNTKSDVIQLWSRDTEKWANGGNDAYELGYPVFRMGRYYHMNIEAYEMYFNRDYMAEERGETSEYRLPLDALEFSITNQMATHTGTIGDNGTVMLLASDASVDKVTLGADGKAVYSFYAGFPNYSDDYTLPLSMRTEIHGQTLTYPPSGETFKGIVLGQNDVPGSNFVTAGPNMVDFVLRDPPGSNSYATLESGSTLKAYHSLTVASTVTGSVGGEISVGPTITISEGTATISNISETNVVIKDEGELTINNKNEDYNSWSVAYSLDKSMSTSSSPEYVGADGDVFIGCSSNITIAQAKKLDFVPSNSDDGCLGQRDTKYVLATKDCLSTGAKYNTDFIYTQKHIKESLIPMLYETRKQLVSSENIVNDFNSLPENTTSKPKYYALPTTDFSKLELKVNEDYVVKFNDGLQQSDTIAVYTEWIKGWMNVLAKNEETKTKAIKDSTKKTYTYSVKDIGSGNVEDDSILRIVTAEYGYLGNKSFDSGTIIDESVEMASELEESFNKTTDLEFFINTHNGYLQDDIGLIVNIGGGRSGGTGVTDGSTVTSTRKMSYHLEDQDAGDYFSVDVYLPSSITPEDSTSIKSDSDESSDDSGYNQSYVFALRGGQSTCPYEGPTLTEYYTPGTQISAGTIPVAVPQMTIDNANVSGVASGKSASFVAKLSSESSAKCGAWYQLEVEERSNPNGLELSIDGQSLSTPRLFYLNPSECIQKTIIAKQTRTDVLDYENIILKFGSSCDDNVYKSLPLAVSFVPASTDLTLKLSDITVNTLTNDGSVTMTVSDFDRQFTNFAVIRLKYRRKGDTNWLTLYSFVNDQEMLEEINAMPEDGKYTLLESSKASYIWDMSKLADAQYEVIGEAVSLNGRDEIKTVTDIQIITLDLTPPTIIGMPTPTDGILRADGEIGVTFNEDIQYSALNYTNFSIDAHLNNQEVGHTSALNFSAGSQPASTEAKITLSSDFTIEGWYKREPGKDGTLLKHGDKLALGVNSSNELCLTVNGETTASGRAPITNGEVDQDWQYFQLCYDSKSKRMQVNNLYGTESNFDKLCFIDITLSDNYSNRERFYLGGDFNGQMHEVRMYDVKRSISDAVQSKSETLAGTEDNLIGYWQASEGHGNFATDKARSRNLSVPAGWYISEKNYAPHFDGSDYALINVSTTPITSKQSMLMEFWFRGNAQENATLVSSKSDNPNFYVAFDKDGKLTFGTTESETVISDEDYLDGNWHHFALNVLRGSNATVYIDGMGVKQFSASEVAPIETAALILAATVKQVNGGAEPVFSNFFEGAIDEFRLWRIRTTAEVIRDRMYKRMNGDEAGLIGYYPFEAWNEVAGQTIMEQSWANEAAVSNKQVESAVAVGNVLFSDDAPSLLTPEGEISRYTAQWTANERKIVLTPDLPKYRMEGCSLNFTVQDVYDSNGNRQVDPIVWSAFISQNRLTWSENSVDLKQEVEESTTFTVDVTNGGSDTENWVLKNVPSWLSVSKESGTLKPLATERITFTVLPSTNTGIYDVAIYLSGNDGMNSPLNVNLKVTAVKPNWAVNPSKYNQSMNMIAKLQYGEQIAEDEDDMIAAFDGDECVGVASPIFIKEYDSYLVFMTIYGTDESPDAKLKLKAWRAQTGIVYPKVAICDGSTVSETITYETDMVYGSLSAPYLLTAQDYIEQGIALTEGWNWISFYTLPDDNTPEETFRSVTESYNGSDIIHVKGKDYYWQYHNTEGSGGSLETMSLSEMYMAFLPEAADLLVAGQRVSPADVPITLNNGWSWIGVPLEGVCAIERAFADAEPCNGDLIKSKTKFSVYDGSRWIGEIAYLAPGNGYEYYSSAGMAKTFTYPSSYSTSMMKAPEENAYDLRWYCDNTPYHGNMSVLAQVFKDGELLTGIELAAFNGEECRGTQIANDNGRIFLTVAGDVPVDLTLRAYDHNAGVEYECVGTLQYIDNAIIGTLVEPMIIDLDKSGIDGISADADDYEYYDLLGYKVTHPANNHFYIVRNKKNGIAYKMLYSEFESQHNNEMNTK